MESTLINIKIYLTLILNSLFLSSISIPWIIRLGKQFNIIDKPNLRKQHKHEIVRIGGIAIFLGYLTSLLIFLNFSNFFSESIREINTLTLLISSSSLFFIIGLLDDLFQLSAIKRLIIQFIFATICWSFGLSITSIDISWLKINLSSIELPLIISYLLTIIWLVGITNAINWLDGLDGLASGVSVITLSGIASISYFNDNQLVSLLSFSLLGACLGFLIFNTKPAKILMGDSGSYLLGFSLASLTLEGINNDANVSFLHLGLLVLLVPIIDMFYVIILRIKNKRSPFYPDRNHIHHRLLNIGFSYRRTLFTIYTLCLICSVPLLNLNNSIESIPFYIITSISLFFMMALLFLRK